MTYDAYLSGAMSGLPGLNYPAFHLAAATLRGMGLTVFNPAEAFDGITTLPRHIYMRADIEALLRSRSVVTLDGWKESKGAQLEVAIALEIGTPVWSLEDIVRAYNVYRPKNIGAAMVQRGGM